MNKNDLISILMLIEICLAFAMGYLTGIHG